MGAQHHSPASSLLVGTSFQHGLKNSKKKAISSHSEPLGRSGRPLLLCSSSEPEKGKGIKKRLLLNGAHTLGGFAS